MLELKCSAEFSQRCLGRTTTTLKEVFMKTISFITWIILVSLDFSKMVKLNVMPLVKLTII